MQYYYWHKASILVQTLENIISLLGSYVTKSEYSDSVAFVRIVWCSCRISLGIKKSKITACYLRNKKIVQNRSTSQSRPLLDKMMSCNQWHIGVHQRHLMFKNHWRVPHETIYGHKKEGVPGQNISIGSFYVSFYNVSIYTSKWLQKLVMNKSNNCTNSC